MIETISELISICEKVIKTGEASKSIQMNIDVLLSKDDQGEYIIPPVHCQRNHVEHAQDLESQFEERGGFVDGLGNNFHIAVPTRDFNVYSGNVVSFTYKELQPTLQNGNSRRHLWSQNCPENYLPKDGTIEVVVKPYNDYQTIKSDYDLIDNKNNAQQGKDEIFGAYRAHNIHKNLKGFIMSGKLGRVFKFAMGNEKTSAFKSVGTYKDELVCLSNIKDYDAAWSFMGKNNANRPCALAAVLLLLKDTNREDNTKDFITRIVEEGKIYHEAPLDYFTKVFSKFNVVYNSIDDTFQKTKLDDFVMTPIERILWETFEIPRISKQPGGDQVVPRLSYFGGGAQYQFTGWKKIVSFYLYMIQKGRDNNASYLTERGQIVLATKGTGSERKERIKVFGGHYEYKGKEQVIISPYDKIIHSIFGEEEEFGTLDALFE